MIRALLLTAVVALAAAAPASAQLIGQEDRIELANALAEAAEEQDVCYEWNIDLDGAPDVGSSAGPDVGADQATCPKGFVRLVASINYTCESCEGEDGAGFEIQSNFDDARLKQDLKDLGYDEGDLLSETDDEAAVNMIGALPALIADRAGLPAVPFEPTTIAAGEQGAPTGKPGSDLLRENRWTLAFGALLLLGGLGWWLAGRMGLLQSGTARAAEKDN